VGGQPSFERNEYGETQRTQHQLSIYDYIENNQEDALAPRIPSHLLFHPRTPCSLPADLPIDDNTNNNVSNAIFLPAEVLKLIDLLSKGDLIPRDALPDLWPLSRSLARQARITAYRINGLVVNEYLVKIRHFPYTQSRVSPTPYPPTLGPSERLTFISHYTTLPLIFTSLHTSFLFCSILNLAVTIIFLANADSLLLFFYCSSVSWFRPTIVLIFIFTPFSLLSLCINTLLTLNTTPAFDCLLCTA
jgi:hypothetical protein